MYTVVVSNLFIDKIEWFTNNQYCYVIAYNSALYCKLNNIYDCLLVHQKCEFLIIYKFNLI